jgi:methionyl-tRNA synthetase
VQELWKRLAKAQALEKRSYAGLYCTGCERFYTKKDLVEGKCPLHLTVPEEVKEENYFFLLSRENAWLEQLLRDESGYRIIPDSRAPETLQLIKQGLEDVSFSRPKSSLSWGIPVPGDEDQTMYVWCDALTNYISGIGLLTDHAEERWWDEATVTHVIGKDIARFHALIWPAMLKHSGLRTPDHLLIHGFLTSDGQKMSKTIGNVIAPEEVLNHFQGNPDPLRFYLSHEIPVGNDGDFSWKRIDEIYDSKLRNQLGNLLNRVLVLLRKETGMLSIPADAPERSSIVALWQDYTDSMESFALSDALRTVTQLVDAMNGRMNELQPWKMEGETKKQCLSVFAEQLRHIALALIPFVPETAQRMATQLSLPYAEHMLGKDFVITEKMKEWGGESEWKSVGEPQILFPPLAK